MTDLPSPVRCVVVGASLAGLRAAEALTRRGFGGEVVLVGAETERPYNRPPLSKEMLSGEPEIEWLRPGRALGNATWLTGDPVVAADLAARQVTTAAGRCLDFDGLVVASGLRPRDLGLPGPAAGRFVLRTAAHAFDLRAGLRAASGVVVIGAGFIGCEVAATAAALGLPVDVVAPESEPLQRAVGEVVGREVQRRLEAAGVVFHLGVLPTEVLGRDSAESVVLSDGTEVRADLVVEAAGAIPNVEWLAGNGLDLSDGVLCDAELRIQGRPELTACGDVARFPNRRYGGIPSRVEHWTMAVDTGKQAGRALAKHVAGPIAGHGDDFAPLPSFWSEMGTTRLQSFGSLTLGIEDVQVLEGDLAGEAVVGYHDAAGALVGVVLLGAAGRYAFYREAVSAYGVGVSLS